MWKIVVVVSVLATGCGSLSKNERRGAGAVFAAAGTGLFVKAATCSGTECGLEALNQNVLGIAAVVVAAVMIIPTISTSVEPAPEVEPPPVIAGPPVSEPPTTDRMLRQLSLQASVAARAGRCVTVETIADRVEELDRRYRRIGFVADPLVAACLD